MSTLIGIPDVHTCSQCGTKFNGLVCPNRRCWQATEKTARNGCANPILTRAEWETEWAKIDPLTVGRSMSLNAYARLCNEIKQTWKIPHEFSSNARYEVYLEGLLEKGIPVPDDILAQVDPDANRYHDVPRVGDRIQQLA